MGRYLFRIPDKDAFPEHALSQAQVIGLEGVPWTGSTSLQGDQLVVIRHVDLSGRLLVPFESSALGTVHLPTATLPESEHPWELDLELARGTISRLRNQVALWEEAGVTFPDDIRRRISTLNRDFSICLFEESLDDPNPISFSALTERALTVMTDATRAFVSQVNEFLAKDASSVPVHCGVVSRGPEVDSPLPTIQMAPKILKSGATKGLPDIAPFTQAVEWAEALGSSRLGIVGPLLDFARPDLPEWLATTTSFEQKLALARNVCRSVGQQFGSRLRLFAPFAGINGVGHQHFNYPQQLQLVMECLEVLDRSMSGASIIVGFDQPWGERLAMTNGGVPAMDIVESLLRYGSRISAIALEFNIGYVPHGTFVRDPLQWVDLIDRWSQFGLPLVIHLTAPIGMDDQLPDSRFSQTVSKSCLGDKFPRHLATIIELLQSRPAVNVVAWKYPYDNDNSRFPLCGLFDADGKPKREAEPIVAALSKEPVGGRQR